MTKFKTISATILLSISLPLSAFTNISMDEKMYTPNELKKIDESKLKTKYEKYIFEQSKVNASYEYGVKTKYAKELLPSAKAGLYKLYESGYAPAAYTLGQLEEHEIREGCVGADIVAKCMRFISPSVVEYYSFAAAADITGAAAIKLANYYQETRTVEGEKMASAWFEEGISFKRAYMKKAREANAYPEPDYK